MRPHTPWYNSEIHQKRQERRQAEARWRKSGLTVHKEIFCSLRNETNHLIKVAKTMHYNNKVEDCGNDQKALFNLIKQLTSQSSTQKLPSHDSIEEVLEKFSTFFVSKIHNIRQNLDKEGNGTDTSINGNENIPAQLASFDPVSVDSITKVIMKSPTKSCSLDPIPTWLLKESLDVLAPAVTKIINTSITTSTFPSIMKQALVTPLLKKPSLDTEILKNYRPVSNLSFLSKLTERVIANQLSSHMTVNKQYMPVQSAYRPLHSTETALLKVMNDLLLAVDNRNGVILVLLDLSAAFDTIDHDILINRLAQQIGITGQALQWFQSYLKGRFQAIHLNGKASKPVLLVFGVPQGSVLGPVMFIIYQSPLYNIAQKHAVNMHCYADDTQVYFIYDIDSPLDFDRATEKVEACIDEIRTWMAENKLKLNDDKTEVLIVSSDRQKHKVNQQGINIGGYQINPSPSAKNLGVLFDEHLKMEKHIGSITKSSYLQLRTIGKIRKYLNPDSLQKLIHAFISSRLDYNNSLLHGLPKCQLDRLQRIQNSAARIVCGCKKTDHITPHLMELHWLPVKYRIMFKILVLTYRCLHDLAPPYLSDLLSAHQPTRNLRSSKDNLLTVPRTKLSTYGDRAFSKAAPLLWNSLPTEIRDSSTLNSFRSSLKTHLYKQAFNI